MTNNLSSVVLGVCFLFFLIFPIHNLVKFHRERKRNVGLTVKEQRAAEREERHERVMRLLSEFNESEDYGKIRLITCLEEEPFIIQRLEFHHGQESAVWETIARFRELTDAQQVFDEMVSGVRQASTWGKKILQESRINEKT